MRPSVGYTPLPETVRADGQETTGVKRLAINAPWVLVGRPWRSKRDELYNFTSDVGKRTPPEDGSESGERIARERLEMKDLRAKQSEKQRTMEPVFQESAQVLVDLCTLRFAATVGERHPGCVLIVRNSSIRIRHNQIHIQESLISLFINADDAGQECGLNVHGGIR